jgi:uncharacterized membrane protein YbhN (UPF0104 family)
MNQMNRTVVWAARLLTSMILLIAVLFYISINDKKISIDALKDNEGFVAITFGLIVLVFLSAYVRFRLTAIAMGVRVPERLLIASFSAGQIGAYLPLGIVGQAAARGAILTRVGVPTTSVAIGTAIERIATFGTLLLLALPAGLMIFGADGSGDPRLVFSASFTMAIGAAISLVLIAAIVKRHRWARGITAFRAAVPLSVFARVLGLSLLSTFFMAGAYFAALSAVSPIPDVGRMVAGIFIVMLGAAFPISSGGWGVREVSATLVLTALGVEPERALLMSLVVGGLSLLVVVLLAPLMFLVHGRQADAVAQKAAHKSAGQDELTKAAVLVLAACAAVLLFVQVPVPLIGTVVTVSAADLPILLLATVLLLRKDEIVSIWREHRSYITALAIISAVMVIWSVIGLTNGTPNSWGLINRMIGWFVIFSYATTGLIVVKVVGARGVHLVMSNLAIAMIAVMAMVFALSFLAYVDHIPSDSVRYVIQSGFSANPNAFGFLIVLAYCGFVMSRSSADPTARRRATVLLTMFVVIALIMSGSRTSWVLFAFALIYCFVLKRIDFVDLAAAVIVVAVLFDPIRSVVADIAAGALPTNGDDGGPSGLRLLAPSTFLRASSDAQRWESIEQALALWLSHPWFGLGFGGYLSWRNEQGLAPLVIHNVPAWLLAETGLIGTLLVTPSWSCCTASRRSCADPVGGGWRRRPWPSSCFSASVPWSTTSSFSGPSGSSSAF